MKIVVLDGYAANPGDLSWEKLAELGELTVYDRTAPEDTAARIADADMALTNKTVLSRDLMAGAKRLKYIGVLATGYNVVDTAAARARGIHVCTVVQAHGNSARIARIPHWNTRKCLHLRCRIARVNGALHQFPRHIDQLHDAHTP